MNATTKRTKKAAPASGTAAGTAAGNAAGKAAGKAEGKAAGKAAGSAAPAAPPAGEWPLWEVFVRSRAGLDHKHCGSLHAADPAMALQMAREVYTRRQEGVSLWVVRSEHIVASDPGDRDMLFDPMEDKIYRHPSFYKLPAEVDQM